MSATPDDKTPKPWWLPTLPPWQAEIVEAFANGTAQRVLHYGGNTTSGKTRILLASIVTHAYRHPAPVIGIFTTPKAFADLFTRYGWPCSICNEAITIQAKDGLPAVTFTVQQINK